MAELFSNNAATLLNGAINDTTQAILLQTGTGAKFPAPTGGDYFYATLFSLVGTSEVNHEIVKCTARSTDTLTVTRGQQGTTARSWSDASFIQHRATRDTLNGMLQRGVTEVVSGNHQFAATQSKSFGVASDLRWYRVGSITAGSPGAELTFRFEYASATGRHVVELRLARMGGAAGSGSLRAELRNINGESSSTYGFQYIRWVDGGAGNPCHIDVKYRYSQTQTTSVMVTQDSATGSFLWVPDADFTAQGTGAQGVALEADDRYALYDNKNSGMFRIDGNGSPVMVPWQKSGAPAPGDVPEGTARLIRDTGTGNLRWYYNNSGTLISAAFS